MSKSAANNICIETHLQKIAYTKEQLKTATGYRKRDLQKYLKRLYRELKSIKYSKPL